MSFAAKEGKKSQQNKDKKTPHTVLQKLSPKPTPGPLVYISASIYLNWGNNNILVG